MPWKQGRGYWSRRDTRWGASYVPWIQGRGYWGRSDTQGVTCLGSKVGVTGVVVTLGGVLATCLGSKVGVTGVDLTLMV